MDSETLRVSGREERERGEGRGREPRSASGEGGEQPEGASESLSDSVSLGGPGGETQAKRERERLVREGGREGERESLQNSS